VFRFHGTEADVREDRATKDTPGMQEDDQGGEQARHRHDQLPRVSRHDAWIQELCSQAVSRSHWKTS